MNTKKAIKYIQLTTTGNDDILLGANDKRESLYITAPTGQNLFIKFGEVCTLASLGLQLPAPVQPYFFTKDVIGDSITLPIHVMAGGAFAVTAMEISNGG